MIFFFLASKSQTHELKIRTPIVAQTCVQCLSVLAGHTAETFVGAAGLFIVTVQTAVNRQGGPKTETRDFFAETPAENALEEENDFCLNVEAAVMAVPAEERSDMGCFAL